MLNNIEAVIFDMDGTLLDSMNVWKDIDTEFMGSRNLTTPEGFYSHIEGKNFHETAVYFKETFSLEESVDEIKDIWHHMAFEKYCNDITLKEGAADFLDRLSAMEIKMGIATSSSRELAEACLTSSGIIDRFGAIITGSDVSKGKPSPEIYLTAADQLGVSPEKCLIFEDVPNGIRAGINAGMKTCAVYDDFSAHLTTVKKELADYYIENFNQIIL